MFKRSITSIDLLKLAGALVFCVSWAVLVHYLSPALPLSKHPWLFSLEGSIGAGLVCFGFFCFSYLRDL